MNSVSNIFVPGTSQAVFKYNEVKVRHVHVFSGSMISQLERDDLSCCHKNIKKTSSKFIKRRQCFTLKSKNSNNTRTNILRINLIFLKYEHWKKITGKNFEYPEGNWGYFKWTCIKKLSILSLVSRIFVALPLHFPN